MLLYHLTLRGRHLLILADGLLPGCGDGKRPVSWLCSRALVPWAVRHVAAHQDCKPAELVLLCVSVPRSKLRRIRRGIWITADPVPPAAIKYAICPALDTADCREHVESIPRFAQGFCK